jgi:S1-C subfamily serine protease
MRGIAVHMRGMAVAALWLLLASVVSGQQTGTLHITVTLTDAQGRVTPVPRHALLISDEPPTAVPRRILTALDGTATVSLRPGTYIVESDNPVAFEGKSYDWAQPVQVVAGRDASLELTSKNAEAGAVTAETRPLEAPLETEPSLKLEPWQDSVVALWTPTARASAFLIDAVGLLATSARAIGSAPAVEVQVSATLKVPGRVLAADHAKDVAVVRVDPAALGAAKPVPFDCESAAASPLAFRQKVYTIGYPVPDAKSLTPGEIRRAEGRAIVTDLVVPDAAAGGPLFSADGALAGLTTIVEDRDTRTSERVRVVPLADACTVIAAARSKLGSDQAPAAVHLPIEPSRGFPADALKNAPKGAAVNRTEYMASSPDFDIAFLTPPLIAGAQQQAQSTSRQAQVGGRVVNAQPAADRALADFANWSDYVAENPPVLMVRVTPRLVEGLWTKVARGAAITQGAYIPSLKHFKTGFLRMRAFCGDAEVLPVHPFVLEHQTSETESIDEGLYVFEPDSLGPQCGTVKLLLYSNNAPEKADTRPIDPKVIQRAWQDFAAWRAAP